VAAVQVVAAVAGHHADAGLEAAGEQEAQQLAGRLVGPVDVLDDEEQRTAAAQLLEDRVHRLEEIGAVDAVGAVGGVRPRGRVFAGLVAEHATGGHQPGDAGRGGDQRLGKGGRLGGQPAECLAEREVRHGALAEVETVPDQDAPSVGLGAVAQLAQEAGLADSGVSGEQDRSGRGAVRRPETDQARQPVELLSSTDQRASYLGHRHVPHHGGCDERREHRRFGRPDHGRPRHGRHSRGRGRLLGHRALAMLVPAVEVAVRTGRVVTERGADPLVAVGVLGLGEGPDDGMHGVLLRWCCGAPTR
jgi:hypothetical protein